LQSFPRASVDHLANAWIRSLMTDIHKKASTRCKSSIYSSARAPYECGNDVEVIHNFCGHRCGATYSLPHATRAFMRRPKFEQDCRADVRALCGIMIATLHRRDEAHVTVHSGQNQASSSRKLGRERSAARLDFANRSAQSFINNQTKKRGQQTRPTRRMALPTAHTVRRLDNVLRGVGYAKSGGSRQPDP
jgi:hypothetical protein